MEKKIISRIQMKLLEKYLPVYQFSETHSTIVNASQEQCYKETFQLDLSDSWIIKNLFRLRGLPASAQKLFQFADKMNFTLLEQNKFDEFLFGFWVNDGIRRVDDKKSFIENDLGWSTKVVWNFEFDEVSENKTKITTNTNVKCITSKSKRLFSVYWFFIGPFSALIRKRMLKMLKKKLEN